jgi:hypothetical protein
LNFIKEIGKLEKLKKTKKYYSKDNKKYPKI